MVSSSTQADISLDAVFSTIPTSLRGRLVGSHRDLKRAFLKGEYDACGLRAGRMCEVVIRIIEEMLTGNHTPFGTKMNVSDVCRAFEKQPKTSGHETLRVIIPRAVEFLYTLRNKRDIGHIGGDVDANAIDAITAVRLADWILCELLRITHGVSLEEAQALVDTLATRETPLVWVVSGKRRVLDPALSFREKTLVLLYSAETAVLVEDLFVWVEHSNFSVYKRDVLRKLHRERLLEFNEVDGLVELSPTGARVAEAKLGPQDLLASP